MRGLSGIDLVKKIKQIDSPVPILLMTGYSEITAEEVLKLGAVGIIPKPIDFDKIVKFIEKNK